MHKVEMLKRILDEFRKSSRPLDLHELSQRLGIESSALDGMLQLLLRQGKLNEVSPSTEACTNCAGRIGCGSIQMSNMMGKTYELIK